MTTRKQNRSTQSTRLNPFRRKPRTKNRPARTLSLEGLEQRQLLTTVGFTGNYDLANWSESGIAEGTTFIDASAAPDAATFGYNVDLSAAATGISQRTAGFTVNSLVTGNVEFDYEFAGDHNFYLARAQFQIGNSTDGGTESIVDASTLGVFTFSGSTRFISRHGEAFSFLVGGENDDFMSTLNGTLTITNFVAHDSIVVDSTSDVDDNDISAGNLSLREAIRLANSIPGADAITFDSSFDTAQNIQLTTQLPTISR